MADFVKEWKRNVRFSVNRSERILLKVSETEQQVWLTLVKVLQSRRNSGPQIETFLYLVRKYMDNIDDRKTQARAEWKSVNRKKQILFKVSTEEKEQWDVFVRRFGSSSVNAFIYLMDKEYTFQDYVEVINESNL
jgi:hypothetical protein